MAIKTLTVEQFHFDGNKANNVFAFPTDGWDEVTYQSTLIEGTAATVVLTVERSMDGVTWQDKTASGKTISATGATEDSATAIEAPFERVRASTPEGGTCILHLAAHLRKDN